MPNKVLQNLKHKLIVSCQALDNEPMYSPEALLGLARSAIEGGASGLRANGAISIRQFKYFFSVPVIGLIKKVYPDSEVYITPTIKEVDTAVIAGSDIVAIDATNRIRPNNQDLKALVDYTHNKYQVPVMADISTLEEGIKAQELGFDMVGTTLSGYTSYSRKSEDPDFELLEKLVDKLNIPIIMEGKIWHPEEVKIAFDKGAFSVVVGSAITRPQLITKRFKMAEK